MIVIHKELINHMKLIRVTKATVPSQPASLSFTIFTRYLRLRKSNATEHSFEPRCCVNGHISRNYSFEIPHAISYATLDVIRLGFASVLMNGSLVGSLMMSSSGDKREDWT